MKKLLIILAAVLCLTACKKETDDTPQPVGDKSTVRFDFNPYQMEPMKGGTKNASLSTVCSRLDVYIIDTVAADTLRCHQERGTTPGFGSLTATLQTTKTYKLVAVGHNTDDTCTFNGGIVSFADDKVKQSLVSVVTFTPADSLNLHVVMQRIVGMFKLRIADPDEEFANVAKFQFTVDSAYNRWNVNTSHGSVLTSRVHTITGTNRGSDGYVTYNVYIIPDNLTDIRHVDITASALDASDQPIETRHFPSVPVKAGYVTKYTGTFFITFDMSFLFEVGDWGELSDTSF